MGVEIHDESLEEYDGYAFPLVEGSVIEGGNLDYVKALAVHPLAREALELIREAFPDYRFVPPIAIKESFYPEHMTADLLVIKYKNDPRSLVIKAFENAIKAIKGL